MSDHSRHPEIETLWRAVQTSGTRSLCLLSAQRREGTSTLAELAWRRAALAGGSALLVDLHREAASQGKRLASGAPGEILRIGDTRLGLLAEPDAASLAAWRDPARLAEAIEGWQRDWDMVILDAAPALADTSGQEIPGCAAAAAAEATVLVVLAGRTSASRLRQAQHCLAQSGARLLGSVLNDHQQPSLQLELLRGARRLARLLPRLSRRLTGALSRSALLSLRV